MLALHLVLLLSATFLLGSCIPQLVIFLSNQGLLGSYGLRCPLLRGKSLSEWTDFERQYVFTRLLKDFMLVGGFVLQHSLMASDCWKQFLLHCNIFVSERLLYVMASSFTLNTMIGQWVSTPDVMLWEIETEDRVLNWLFFILLHIAAWLILFLQVAVMDPLELIGFKQVYNYHKGIGSPLSHMSKPLQTFYRHLRHAGPTSLCLVLWVHPVMTLDRLLLALAFSFYLALAHQVSLADYKFAHSHFVLQETTTTQYRFYRE